MRTRIYRHRLLTGTIAVTGLALAACGGSSDDKAAAPTTAGGGSAATAAPAGDDDNSVVIWSAVDQPIQDGLQKALTAKLAADGIKVDWQKVDDVNNLIIQKIQAKDTPDIVLIPQPGVVAQIVGLDAAFPIDTVVDMAALKSTMVPGTLEAGVVAGKQYGLLVSMNVKSLVYYPKQAWDTAGYKAPTTIDELNALTEQIKSDGGTPWCMGIESGPATGWPATDWLEDLVMRYGGADGYNQWVSHEMLFDSDVVKQAAAEFEKLMFTEGNVLGGREAISSTNFGDAGRPMFDAGGPKCWMLKQGSFITGFFPDSIKADLDANVGLFGFPPATAGGDAPVLGGGDQAVMLDNSASTQKAMQYLSETDIGTAAASSSTFLSPHKDFDVSGYPDQITKSVAEVAYSASSFLFDGSDQMPAEVGSGTFWKEMTSWISGSEDLDSALKNIDASWPKG